MSDDDEVAKAVDESPPRRIEEELGLGRPASEAVVVVESEGVEFGGSEVRGEVKVDGDGDGDGEGIGGAEAERDGEIRIVGSSEVEIDQGDDSALMNGAEWAEEEGDVKSSDVGGGSELWSELDVGKLDSDAKLEALVAAEDYGVDDLVEEEGEEIEKNLAARCDMEWIDEASKMVDEENGDKNVVGNSDLSGVILVDCHEEDVAKEKGGKFEKNVTVEE